MGLLNKAGRYWHTLRHLRPVQFYGRVWFRYSRPKPDLRAAPALRLRAGVWQAPARRLASMTGPRSFVFLNEPGGLDEIGWDGEQREKLWRYNQHYFDDLNAIDAEARRAWHLALIEDWIAHNPPGQGNGWEPYPLSLRVVNWVKWALSGGELSPAALHSLAVQARWLTGRLEIHLLGNHLFANGKALLFAGLFFEGAEADGWRKTALAILAREIPEQFLPDGGQFELSTMYHALALEDALDLLDVTACYGGGRAAVGGAASDLVVGGAASDAAMDDCARVRGLLAPRVGAMRHWLRVMCHPDGEIALFNDAAIGIAPSVVELEAYFARCAPDVAAPGLKTVEHLADSGYIRLTASSPAGAPQGANQAAGGGAAVDDGTAAFAAGAAPTGGGIDASVGAPQGANNGEIIPAAVALLDVARVGPDYLPGHAHADSLSFELSVFGRRLLVNGGTSCYGTSAERLRQRGTAAHNTVVVDGQDSSEVWGGFRVARRAYPHGLQVRADGQGAVVRCSHDGYRWLPGRPRHTRQWTLHAAELVVDDELAGDYRAAVAQYRFHPGVAVSIEADGRSGTAALLGGERVRWVIEHGDGELVSSSWHPHFGVSMPCSLLRVRLAGGRARVRFGWGERTN
ncbi:heparinase II/III family protein [Thauera sp. SWB20]|uniref:heparinase II/III family protein n=1 Tax=Thauera sp. SWB20 TaxID=1572758 RepID=UPI0005ADFD47|nr:alginate lyase family protein [Thauera sp. SWB20]KIN90189.1 heparinase II/III-like family protein [Thauera sp. SWB20]